MRSIADPRSQPLFASGSCSLTGFAALVLVLLSACATSDDQGAGRSDDAPPAVSAAAADQTVGHVLEEIAPGVYFADAAGTGEILLASNAMVVVNRDDVLVVDSHITADAADSLIRAVRTITDKPIRYLVNSHFHFDHAHGNQSFSGLASDVQIVGHEYTRERMLTDVLAEPTYQTIGAPAAQEGIAMQLERQIDALDAEADAETRSSLQAQLVMLRRHIEALAEVVPTPPNLTLLDKLTLHRGDREIQLLHLGRGHTGGDVVVYLPAEKIAFTGDLFYAGAPYLGDGFADEFVDTLGRLAELDVDVFVPGHGPLVRDKAQIAFNQEYLRKYWRQVSDSHAAGRSVEEAIAELDLSGYEEFAAFQTNMPAVLELEVRRMYELLELR
ncbi:MAG: MBL fold metallo-hydrolase [Acidobacteria bacterium]|nr:MAG: MBL fold metallo-hydrolase [Acidobacteriota bacterium]REK05383.1 MAG: MBL fold metallo-hydrolase [Acidobacteriota bacterium]